MRAAARRNVRNTDGFVALEDDAGDAGVRAQVEVRLDVHDTVDIRCRMALVAVGSPSKGTHQ